MSLCENINPPETSDTRGFSPPHRIFSHASEGYLRERPSGRTEKASWQFRSGKMECPPSLYPPPHPMRKHKLLGPIYLENKSLQPVGEGKRNLLSLGHR